jgi:hypothetical protein
MFYNGRVVMKKTLLVILFSFSASIFAAMPIFTQTYDLDEFVYCEGLYLDGMTYSFTVSGIPNLDCGAPRGGPGNTNNVNDPSIEGTTS